MGYVQASRLVSRNSVYIWGPADESLLCLSVWHEHHPAKYLTGGLTLSSHWSKISLAPVLADPRVTRSDDSWIAWLTCLYSSGNSFWNNYALTLRFRLLAEF